MSNIKWIFIVFVFGLAVSGCVKKPTVQTNQPVSSDESSQETSPSSRAVMNETAVVGYTSDGFSPNSVTIKTGEAVTFRNESDEPMWVASDEHPSHQLLPGFDQLQAVGKGSTYTFTFNTAGRWGFHNHKNSSQSGTIIVN